MIFALLLAGLSAPLRADEPPYAQLPERWVLIDTAARRALVYQGATAIAEFDRIAIGSRGVARLRLAGDNTTPLGQFRIDRISRDSRFHIFLGLNYPTLQDVDRAHRHGLIGDREYWEIFDRMLALGRSPQDTVLGGNIGLHGVGNGDLAIHNAFDWTRGCIALTNEQIERLAEYVTVGTPVVIR